ncbi:hypothetical protein PVA38_11220 [Streptococcus pneumoniae D39]|nr:hypothetical protein PVA38_11220 [Streptococcus pneumoniae D39]
MYKRQVDNHVLTLIFLIKICVDTTIKFLFIRLFDTSTLMKRRIFSVSYTHLTLPTKLEV